MRRAVFALMVIAFFVMTALAGVTKPHKQMLFVRDFGTKDKAPLYDTQVYITQPTSMESNTSYTFQFKVDFWSMELDEYLLSFSVTFPAGYTGISATDPPPVDEGAYGSHWTHTVSGTTVTWTFAHYCDPQSGWGCGWGDAHVGSSITFSATATTDAAATNRFQYTVTGDFGNTLSGTAYVGGPRIISTSPVWFAAIEPDEPIVITFSEPINSATLEFSTDPEVGGWEGTWNDDKTQVTLTHDDFPKNTSVLLSIPEYKDLSGIKGTPRTILFFIPPDPIQSTFTYIIPVADGFIAPGEWDDATVVDISAQGTGKAFLYIKNDAQKLYVALDVPADTKLRQVQMMGVPLAADQAIMSFDENNDDSFPLGKTSGEGVFWFIYSPDVIPPVLIDFLGLYGNWVNGNYSTDEEYVETKVGIDPGLSEMSGHVTYEMFFDFERSYLNPPDFPATVGLTFLVYSAEGNPFNYYYLLLGSAPREFFSGNPATFLDVNLSAGPAPKVIAIDPNWGSPRTVNPVKIYGENFANGCTALLRRDGKDYQLLDIQYIHAAEVDAKVPALTLEEGYYDVVVRNPDKAEGVLEDGYYVGESPPSGDDDDDDDGGTKGIGGCGCSF